MINNWLDLLYFVVIFSLAFLTGYIIGYNQKPR